MDFTSLESNLRKSLSSEGFEIERSIFGALQIFQGEYNILRIYQRPDGDCFIHLADGTERDLPEPLLASAESEVYNETQRLVRHVLQNLIPSLGGTIIENTSLGSRLFRFRLEGETLSVLFEFNKVRIRSSKHESTASICGSLSTLESQLPNVLKMFVFALKSGFKDEVELT